MVLPLQMSASVQAYWRACMAAGAVVDATLVEALEQSHTTQVLRVPDLALSDSAAGLLAQVLQQCTHLTGAACGCAMVMASSVFDLLLSMHSLHQCDTLPGQEIIVREKKAKCTQPRSLCLQSHSHNSMLRYLHVCH